MVQSALWSAQAKFTLGAEDIAIEIRDSRFLLDGADRQVAKLARFTRFLGKATIAQQAVGCRGTIGEFAKPAKMKARCNWRRKLGAADSGERAGRGRC